VLRSVLGLLSLGDRERRAETYVAGLVQDPPDVLVARLAAASDGDEDHARWELRYARRAIGLIVAERDALDDRTSSDVAAALGDAHENDSNIATDRRAIADRQFNDRLRDYRAALADRTATASPAERMGAVLLGYARATTPTNASLRFAGEAIAELVAECNAALRAAYGEADLPADLPPSALVEKTRRREDEKTRRPE
jgi:hypothetical protein